MAAVLGQWRATYTPGEWVLLSGPTSLVLLEPPADEWAPLINTLWDEVVASSSIVDLAARLTSFEIDAMPSFGAFFWTADGMRSLVRGNVSVTDHATGKVVADGEGIQTGVRSALPVCPTSDRHSIRGRRDSAGAAAGRRGGTRLIGCPRCVRARSGQLTSGRADLSWCTRPWVAHRAATRGGRSAVCRARAPSGA